MFSQQERVHGNVLAQTQSAIEPEQHVAGVHVSTYFE
jgi:hypothetical protein